MSIQKQMFKELEDKEIFDQARSHAFTYMDNMEDMDVYPSEKSLKLLDLLDQSIPDHPISAQSIIEELHLVGSPTTIAQTGGRYFGFVNGGALPVTVAAQWLSDVWDQCGGLYLTSPLNAKLESVCESWLKEVLGLPQETVAGFVSGGSMANFCGLAAARFRLYKNLGWDVNEKGLQGAPKLRIITHEQIHASIKKTLTLLGFGKEDIEWVPADSQGRLIIDQLPELDDRSMIILQAGNVNTGAFDAFSTICDRANDAGAWVHIDGAFGLWAAAANSLTYLTEGMEKASSWAVDAHKTLNAPYDSGITLCRDSEALISALQASGEYIIYSDQRDPLLYTPELSKRSRAIELWAALKYLGKSGIDELVTGFHLNAKRLARGLKENGFLILNDVVFNQVLVTCGEPDLTNLTLHKIQQSGECWCGGTSWAGETSIRISICSWATTDEDIERTINIFTKSKQEALKSLKRQAQ